MRSCRVCSLLLPCHCLIHSASLDIADTLVRAVRSLQSPTYQHNLLGLALSSCAVVRYHVPSHSRLIGSMQAQCITKFTWRSSYCSSHSNITLDTSLTTRTARHHCGHKPLQWPLLTAQANVDGETGLEQEARGPVTARLY